MCEGSEGAEDMCGTGGESMSQWDCEVESPSPGGPAGMGFFPVVTGLKAKPVGCSRDCEDMKTPRLGH